LSLEFSIRITLHISQFSNIRILYNETRPGKKGGLLCLTPLSTIFQLYRGSKTWKENFQYDFLTINIKPRKIVPAEDIYISLNIGKLFRLKIFDYKINIEAENSHRSTISSVFCME
jgi:hypothetical protein